MPLDKRTAGDPPSTVREADANAAVLAKRHALRKAMLSLHARIRSRTQLFNCFLDEQPTEPVPAAALKRLHAAIDETKLIVNPSFQVRPLDNPPGEVARRAFPLGGFLGGYPIAWVKDPGPDLWVPFWARGDWIDTVQSLRACDPAPSTLGSNARRVLALATILVPKGFRESRTKQWASICDTARAQFRTRGYAIVRDLLHPFQLGAMRRYYRELVASGGVPLGDFQVAERYQLGNEVLASFYHSQLADLVGRIAAEPVKSSYVYLASYLPGAELQRHTDREQCEFSISLQVDYAPEPDGPCGWPLFLENPGELGVTHSADLGIGDVVIYRGRELVHYRNRLPEAHHSTSLFLHYVRENFAGNLW